MSVEISEIEIAIDNNSNISYRVKGIKGRGCVDATEFLDRELGEVSKREYTREYYEKQVRTSTKITTRR